MQEVYYLRRVCVPVRPHWPKYTPIGGISVKFYVGEISAKICAEDLSVVVVDKGNIYFTWVPAYIYNYSD